MDWLSLLVPIAYLIILIASLATFSSVYRQRKVRAQQSLAPYFPPHTARNIYLSLLHLQDSDPNAAKVPDSILRAALLGRAVEDIKRIMEIRSRKGPLQQLLQKGLVGDEIWQRMLRAEQEINLEVQDVIKEAEALQTGWGQVIFQSANEMVNNAMLRERLKAVEGTIAAEKAAWERTREQARRELEDGDGVVSQKPAVATQPPASAPVMAVGGLEKTVGSDEEGVIVDSPADGAAAQGGGGGKNKKKKGKK